MSFWLIKLFSKNFYIRLMNFWPPYLGTGIWIDEVSSDLKKIKVSLKASFWNLNYRKSHFGGSLYAMTDPFYMLMLQHHLGPTFSVWDKGSEVHYITPGTKTLSATFLLNDQRIDEIRKKLEENRSTTEYFEIEIIENGDIICRIKKSIHIKKRPTILPL